MRDHIIILSLPLLALTTGCLAAHSIASNDRSDDLVSAAKCVPVEEVSRNPALYNGKSITICGYLNFKHEDINLYASKKAAEEHLRKECVAVAYLPDLREHLALLSGSKVAVHGSVTDNICPKDSICLASCSKTGIVVDAVEANGESKVPSNN